MKLKLRNTIIENIESLQELEDYIKKNLYTDLNRIPEKFINDLNLILQNDFIFKTDFIKQIKKIFSENGTVLSRYQIKYWENRGYDSTIVQDLISQKQKNNSKRCIDYWITRGFSYEESNTKVSDVQRRFGNVNKTVPKEILKKRSCFSIEYWISKYGYSIEEAELKVSEVQSQISKKYWDAASYEDKQRHIQRGSKNGMYGKPPPVGSGNGYSGWYNGIFFRSLHELNYLVNILDRYNIKYKSAETLDYRIDYIDKNKNKRTYSGDFIISDKYYVEIKPKNLFNTTENTLKRNAAIEFCKNNNLIYKMTDCGGIKYTQLIDLINDGIVVLTVDSKNKFNKYLLKNGLNTI